MRRTLLPILLLVVVDAAAATLEVTVRDPRGLPVADAVVYALPEGRAVAPPRASAIMDQKNRMFIPHVLPVQTGTAVHFPNSDDIRHQVYSFSAAKTFQLPLYKETPVNPVVFDKPGVVVIGCNIHDRMSAYIVVVDTPHFAATGKEGRVLLRDLGAGRYRVRLWHPGMRTEPEPVEVTLGADERRTLSFAARNTQ
jgi:plastocyanin